MKINRSHNASLKSEFDIVTKELHNKMDVRSTNRWNIPYIILNIYLLYFHRLKTTCNLTPCTYLPGTINFKFPC